jgi:hypothetical protein
MASSETEQAILDLFADRYPLSAMRSGGRRLRLRSWDRLLPQFFRTADALGSFLSAMEQLELKGILFLGWKKRLRGEHLLWAELADPESLYRQLDRRTPEAEAALIRESALEAQAEVESAADTVAGLRAVQANAADLRAAQANAADPGPYFEPGSPGTASFFASLAERADELVGWATPQDIRDTALVLSQAPGAFRGVPIRAVSIKLFKDSKRLERLLSRIKRMHALLSLPLPRGLPLRSYPEVWISGPVELIYEGGRSVIVDRHPLGLSLGSVQALRAVRPIGAAGGLSCLSAPKRALSVENKESFYALSVSELGFSCYVACGGRPNRAVKGFLRLLAAQGWELSHWGDLDPDGIAILGEVHALCGAAPFLMDCATFDAYLAYARSLDDSILSRIRMIPQEVRDLPGIPALIQRIEATRRGVEQEIIDPMG